MRNLYIDLQLHDVKIIMFHKYLFMLRIDTIIILYIFSDMFLFSLIFSYVTVLEFYF